MRRTLHLVVGLACLATPAPSRAADPPRFEFKDGDRVVLIGDTLIERDQKYGYLETLLALRNPEKTITFRNLGWSGDNVYGLARARFGTQADGFNHLKEHVLALRPTVLIVGYGMTDSFEGAAGVPRFESGLNGLLDALGAARARVILLSPLPHADLGRPLPDPSAHNKDLERYAAAIGKVAAARGATFVDLFHEWKELSDAIPELLTDDGIHLTDQGYWFLGVKLAEQLLGPPTPWSARFHHNGRLESATGTTVTIDKTKPSGVHFEALDATLPVPWKKIDRGGVRLAVVKPRLLAAEGLPDGRYRLNIDGSPMTLIAWDADLSAPRPDVKSPLPAASTWARGVELRGCPEFDQVEALRKAINDKNLLYFHRWRPQNETYLLGFRKHEQGNNAREIPLFDPLVEAKEKEIARLRKPVTHRYELAPEAAEEKPRP